MYMYLIGILGCDSAGDHMTMRYRGGVRTARISNFIIDINTELGSIVQCWDLLVKVDGCGLPRLRLVEGADLLDAVEGNPHTHLHHSHIDHHYYTCTCIIISRLSLPGAVEQGG